MAKNQKNYTSEFKQQIVDLYNTGNYSFPQLSKYGVAKSIISGWVKAILSNFILLHKILP